jgi:CheY-like chemotaxis protein
MSADADKRVVLVVEDEEVLRAFLGGVLRAYGWSVLEADSGEHALSVLTTNHVDIVVADIVLGGGMTGWEMAEALRETSPDVPVLYTSAHGCDPARQVAGSVFIGKPYEPFFIIETCNDLMASSQLN